MKLSDTLSISPNVVARTVGNETVLLDLASGTYFGLDPIGARIWTLIEGGAPLQTVCETLLQDYDTTSEEIERDTLALVSQLVEKELVAIDGRAAG